MVASPTASDTSLPVRAPFWASSIATFFGIGRIRPGPGTWASAATVLLWAAASSRIAIANRTWATVAAVALVTLIGIPAATLVARAAAVKDPQFIVIDEVAGQLIALVAVPLAWKTFLAGLILFRVFDILKPFPIRRLELFPEGTGTVAITGRDGAGVALRVEHAHRDHRHQRQVDDHDAGRRA